MLRSAHLRRIMGLRNIPYANSAYSVSSPSCPAPLSQVPSREPPLTGSSTVGQGVPTPSVPFTPCDQLWSAYRFHEAHKSSSGSVRRRNEIIAVARRHADAQQVAAYEFVERHWDRIEQRRTLGEAWRQRGIPGAQLLARCAVPLRDAVPAGVTPEDLRLCENMLRGS